MTNSGFDSSDERSFSTNTHYKEKIKDESRLRHFFEPEISAILNTVHLVYRAIVLLQRLLTSVSGCDLKGARAHAVAPRLPRRDVFLVSVLFALVTLRERFI